MNLTERVSQSQSRHPLPELELGPFAHLVVVCRLLSCGRSTGRPTEGWAQILHFSSRQLFVVLEQQLQILVDVFDGLVRPVLDVHTDGAGEYNVELLARFALAADGVAAGQSLKLHKLPELSTEVRGEGLEEGMRPQKVHHGRYLQVRPLIPRCLQDLGDVLRPVQLQR